MNIKARIKINPSMAKVNFIKSSLVADHNQRIVIDYSSPNIAKPFHFGHLKSTILGNFLANLYKFYGHTVTRLNYIGDWGTQYGLLNLGMEQFAESDLLNFNTSNEFILERLVEIYAKANELGRKDEKFYQLAKEKFKLMDQDNSLISQWNKIRDLSLNELKHSYDLMGIYFDTFEYESDYASEAVKMVNQMKMNGLAREIIDENDSSKVCVAEVMKNDKIFQVPLLKSDQTSLYLSRDIAAVIRRQSKYKFDKILYVVGADQEKHFHCLREIMKKTTQESWVEQIIHVKIGKVVGMSTRSGKFLLLSKIIDEATQRFIESTKNTPTSKVFETKEIQEVARNLALSSLFVYDLRNRRTLSYEFNWESAMKGSSRSGLQLQATYARLSSLRRKSISERRLDVYESLDDVDYGEGSLRTDVTSDATELIECLNKLSETLEVAYKTMDPCPLLNHAFKLCKITNRTRRNGFLQVINEPDEGKARSRLTLFDCSREQLNFIIKSIGLKPLEQI